MPRVISDTPVSTNVQMRDPVPMPLTPEPAAWAAWDSVDLAAEVSLFIPTICKVPHFMRAALRHAYAISLRELENSPDDIGQALAWTLFLLTSRMLLTHTARRGSKTGQQEFDARYMLFCQGHWLELLEQSHTKIRRPGRPGSTTPTLKHDLACKRIRQGEVSYARQALTSSALAPGNDATYKELTDKTRRPREVSQPIPERVKQAPKTEDVRFSRVTFLQNLRSATKGTAAGPSGQRAERLQVLLDDEESAALLSQAAEKNARARLPQPVVKAIRFGRLTALTKPKGGVRGIVTGDIMRRMVARTLAQAYSSAFEEACAPFQYALSTRAGTDCVGHLARAATDLDDERVVVSLDGIGAYDHIRRAAMLTKLHDTTSTTALLPFAKMFYQTPSQYVWQDDTGKEQVITQGEGGEQGDALMPALYALGQHEALKSAAQQLHPDDQIMAYLDDVYLLTNKDRAAEAYRIVSREIENKAGVKPHLGKLEAWSRKGGDAPPGLEQLSPTAWKGNAPAEQNGLVVLGIPVGTPEFVRSWCTDRITEERKLVDQLPALPDLQCAWSLLLHSASARANHVLRQLPPPLARDDGHHRDVAIQECLFPISCSRPAQSYRPRLQAWCAPSPFASEALG